MKLIASAPFELTLKNGEKKQYVLGEQIAAEHADHWWVKAHSTEVDAKAESARLAEQEAGAAELQRLKDENSRLWIRNSNLEEDLEKLAAEVQQLRPLVERAQEQEKELATLRAQRDSLKAELAAGTDQTKDGGKKKSDKETLSK